MIIVIGFCKRKLCITLTRRKFLVKILPVHASFMQHIYTTHFIAETCKTIALCVLFRVQFIIADCSILDVLF